MKSEQLQQITSKEKELPRAEQEAGFEVSQEDQEKELMEKSGAEVAGFEKEGEKGLQAAEKNAETDGLEIDPADRKELEELNQEAEVAQGELKKEISLSSEKENINIKPCPGCGKENKVGNNFCEECGNKFESRKNEGGAEDGKKLYTLGKETIKKMYADGKGDTVKYKELYALLVSRESGEKKWRKIDEIDEEKVGEIMKKIQQEDVFERGKKQIMSLHSKGSSRDAKYLSLYNQLTKNDGGRIVWKEAREVDPILVEKMINDAENIKKPSLLKDRVVETPEMLSAEEASKKFMAEERQKLAQEIRAERKKRHESLLALKVEIEKTKDIAEKLDESVEDKQYEKLSEMQSDEVNAMVTELLSGDELDEQDVNDEHDNLGQLIANSEGINSIKKKIEEHYAKADEIAKKKFESIRKTVEQTILRNNAFIVHTFLTNENLRHNDLSSISKRATLEDDMDILLSLEPSVSTSSVVPGSKQGLWGERIGVVLGGGDIMGARQTDDSTGVGGIKYRGGTRNSSEEIDEKVSDKSERGYNELVVNNPKVFGFFQRAEREASGKMRGFTVYRGETTLDIRKRKEEFMYYMDIASAKGMPLLVMTPDRKVFEFISIDDEGIVTAGAEISPEQVALGKAGLIEEKREELGKSVILKNLFKYIDHQKEAKEIVFGLAGEKLSGDLSREEYLAYARDNKGRLHEFPENLLQEKEVMLKVAESDPRAAYQNAGENLKKDKDFIRKIYSLEGAGEKRPLYSYMPEELKKDEDMARLAIENNDFENIDADFADSSQIWDKIVDKMIEKKDPDRWFSRNIGEKEHSNIYLIRKKGFGSANMTDKLATDPRYISGLNNRYPKYKFKIDEYKNLVVTKLS